MTNLPEQRHPVIGPEQAEQFPEAQIDKQWRYVTEVMRRAVQEKPAVRQCLLEFLNQPVSESLAWEALQQLAPLDQRLANFLDRYKDGQLVRYLNFPPVPDEQLQPDIFNAPKLPNAEASVQMLRDLYTNEDEQYQRTLQRLVDSKHFLTGVTIEERWLVAHRYRFARDIKMLALGAELLEHPVATAPDRHITLPSGVEILLDTNNPEQQQDLLQPTLWERRQQFKDRVYEIAVNGRKYFLKEKKTNRHTDTKRGGHLDGQTSQAEFKTAQHFRDNVTIQEGHFSMNWEQPIGAVTFPDGFSFAVYEFAPGLIGEDQITRKLAAAIERHRQEFEVEYQAVAKAADQYKDSPRVLAFENLKSESALTKVLQWLKLAKTAPSPTLSFEEFATVKAYRMETQARNRMRDLVLAEGYENSDIDGYAYRLIEVDELQLEIVGFDFEYYKKMSPADQETQLLRTQQYRAESLAFERERGLGFSGWSNFKKVTRMEKAAYFALLELEAQAAMEETD